MHGVNLKRVANHKVHSPFSHSLLMLNNMQFCCLTFYMFNLDVHQSGRFTKKILMICNLKCEITLFINCSYVELNKKKKKLHFDLNINSTA